VAGEPGERIEAAGGSAEIVELWKINSCKYERSWCPLNGTRDDHRRVKWILSVTEGWKIGINLILELVKIISRLNLNWVFKSSPTCHIIASLAKGKFQQLNEQKRLD
jgi:hypothetical protein